MNWQIAKGINGGKTNSNEICSREEKKTKTNEEKSMSQPNEHEMNVPLRFLFGLFFFFRTWAQLIKNQRVQEST